MLALTEHFGRASSAWDSALARVANITLGEIWSSVNYHPFPRSVNVLAITLVVLYMGKIWGRRLYTYRRAREIRAYHWPVPEVSWLG